MPPFFFGPLRPAVIGHIYRPYMKSPPNGPEGSSRLVLTLVPNLLSLSFQRPSAGRGFQRDQDGAHAGQDDEQLDQES